MVRVLSYLILVIVLSCTRLKTTTQKTSIEESEISEIARQKLQEARDLIRENQYKNAILKLAELADNSLSPLEKSLKYNLKGVCHFGSGEVEKSLLNFEIAEKYSPQSTHLFSQIQLNTASAYYKLAQFTELKNRLEKVDKKLLTDSENKKLSHLAHAYGVKFNDHAMIVTSSLELLAESKLQSEVLSSALYEPAKTAFNNLKIDEKNQLLEQFSGTQNIAAATLAQTETERRYSAGDRSGSEDVISWLKKDFSENEEVKKFVSDFEFRLDNSSRIAPDAIGLVLPMTGVKSNFGLKALNGIEAALKMLGLDAKLKVHTKDSLDSPAQGAEAVLGLIREHKVAFIIGGLFPENAKAEYLEAKKYGVLYISLSQINLPKEEKNQHLIEVQGSIESQIEVLLSDEMIRKFGTRIGVIYPNNEGGRAYMDEIWRLSAQKNLQITSMATFPRNTHDFRDTSQMFLGLKYPRERSEELRILEDVYAFEKTSIRRVQTLPPVMDFDWVFLASYPQETAQLIPTLGYYDATRIKYIGGPSWGSKSMLKEQKLLGTLYFIGDDPKDINQEILSKFQQNYGKPYGLIEILALDSMKLGAEVLKTTAEVSSRDEFDTKLAEQSEIKGIAASWLYKNGLWLKKMNPMTVSHGEFTKVFGPDAAY